MKINSTVLATLPSGNALRLVLDTNIWLDWLVFDDAGVANIKALVESHKAEIFGDGACGGELARVLAYQRCNTTLDTTAQAACLETYMRVVTRAGRPEKSDVMGGRGLQLPRCRDPDDQKFLELARDCGADFLITKDKALLELERRQASAPPYHIVTPRRQFANRTLPQASN